MYLLLTILAVIASVILVLIVLVQNSKGGGLASSFSSSNQIMGVRKTTDFLEKTTWTLIAFIVVCCIFATGVHKGSGVSATSEVAEEAANLQHEAATAAPFDEAAPAE